MNPDRLYEIIQQLLDQDQPHDYRLNALPANTIQQSGNWWYVVVQPTSPEINASDYANKMSDIEDIVQREYGAHVLLVPSLVD